VAKDRAASFGMRVRAARVAAGITADELAKRVGIGESSLLNLEWSSKRPKQSLARKIVEALGMESAEWANKPNN
jgi:ribosome-binding protein aMBF1 (putative translation factor)